LALGEISFDREAAASDPEPARINFFVWRQKQMLQTSYWNRVNKYLNFYFDLFNKIF
jgi:hypothetical protein